MYNYKFIRIDFKTFGNSPKEDYQDVIKKEGKNGWRLVQVFAPGLGNYGYPKFYELIFERVE